MPEAKLMTDEDAMKVMTRLEKLEKDHEELKRENALLKVKDETEVVPHIITQTPIVGRETEEEFLGKLDESGFPCGQIRPATEFFVVDVRSFTLKVFNGEPETKQRPAIDDLVLRFNRFVGAGADLWDSGFICRCDFSTHMLVNVTSKDLENPELRLSPGTVVRSDGNWSIKEVLDKLDVLRRRIKHMWTAERYRLHIAGPIVEKWNRLKREDQAREVLQEFDAVEAKRMSHPAVVKAFAAK